MKLVRIVTRSPEETRAVAASIGELLRASDVVLLSGDLGAGKTLFAGGVAESLGVTGPVVSPTFTIVREYDGRVPFVHVDIYRLETVRELQDLGFDEVVRDDAVTVVEWGDLVASLFPERLEVRLRSQLDETRVIEISARGASWAARADALAAVVGVTSPSGA